jgi:hypothetical protein
MQQQGEFGMKYDGYGNDAYAMQPGAAGGYQASGQYVGEWTSSRVPGLPSPNITAASSSSNSGSTNQVLPNLSLDWMRSKSPPLAYSQGTAGNNANNNSDWMIRSKSPMMPPPPGGSGGVQTSQQHQQGYHLDPMTMYHASDQQPIYLQYDAGTAVYQQQQLGSPSGRAAAAAAAAHHHQQQQQQQHAVHAAAQAHAQAQATAAAKYHQQANDMYMPNSTQIYGGYYQPAPVPGGAAGQTPMAVIHHPYSQVAGMGGFEAESYPLLDFSQHLDLIFDPSMSTSM